VQRIDSGGFYLFINGKASLSMTGLTQPLVAPENKAIKQLDGLVIGLRWSSPETKDP
jgi:hypothetical protein